MSQFNSSSGANDPSKKPTVLSKDKLYLINGGYNNDINSKATLYSTRLSPAETVSNIKRVHVKQETNDKLDQQGLVNFVQPGHEKISTVKFDNKRFKALAPEIENAALILVSSILSPNDLQNNGLQFDIDNPKLTDITKDAIIEEIDDYFNEKFDMGNKLAEWIKESLFGCGSQPVLVLPDFKFDELKNDSYGTTAVENLTTATTPVTTAATFQSDLDKLIKVPIYTDAVGLERLNFNLPTTTSDLLYFCKENLNEDETIKFRKDMVDPVVESLVNTLSKEISNMFPTVSNVSDNAKMQVSKTSFLNDLTKAVEDTTIKITTRMNDGDMFRITENPEILRFHNKFTFQKKYDLTNRLNKFYSENNKVYTAEPIVAITSEERGDGKKSNTFPTVMVLPPESVIPVCIPGDKKSHIGYFIILDQFGHPLIAEEPPLDQSTCGDGYGASAFDAFFGSRSIRSLNSLVTGSKGLIVSKIFEHILDKYLKSKISNIGLGDMDISQLSSITQVMLRRLMYHKQTIMIFVPESFLTYFAFDYRSDGTGKSKLEDASFILHLRTVYLIAKILAMQKNAISQQTVSFEITDKSADPEQLIEYMRNVFVGSNSINFTANPNDIIKTMGDKAVRFIPKNGYPGLDGFSVESDTDSSGRVDGPDDNLLETLNTLWVDFLDVPHDALNKMGENEYSRSIIANHLFFAKKIINYQSILINHTDKFIRSVIRYAKPLRQSISTLLNKNGTNSDITVATDGSDASNIDIDSIIDSIITSLPTPKIAPDKAQFTEIKEYMDSLDELINRMITDEMIPSSDTNVKDAINTLKAMYKAKLTKQFADVVGIGTIFDLPSLDDTLEAQTELLSIYGVAKNLSRMFESAEAAHDVTKDTEQTYTSDDGSMGGDMGMDMDGGMDDGMGDMGGGDDLFGGDTGGMDMGDTNMDTNADTSLTDISDSINDTSSTDTQDQSFNVNFND